MTVETSVQPDAAPQPWPTTDLRRPRRTVVVSGPRDGAGRTALTAHLAVCALVSGCEVGVLDLDFEHRGLTRWLRRRERAAQTGAQLVLPAAPVASAVPCRDRSDAEAGAAARWSTLLHAMAGAADVLIVDAPTGGGTLARKVHEAADTVLTVVAESAVDLEALLEIDEDGARTGRPGPYARMAWEARRRRGQSGLAVFDWLIVRGRASGEPGPAYDEAFAEAGRLIGARPGPRLIERRAWREGMDTGVTVLDPGGAHPEARPAVTRELEGVMAAAKVAPLEGASLAI